MPEQKSLIDCAYEVLDASKKPLQFKELFDKAVETAHLELSSDAMRSNMSKLYTELTLDSRFTGLEGNVWDLRARHKFDEYYISTDDIIAEDDEEEAEDIDREEQRLEAQELGEEEDDSLDEDSDDLDFDNKNKDSDSEEEF